MLAGIHCPMMVEIRKNPGRPAHSVIYRVAVVGTRLLQGLVDVVVPGRTLLLPIGRRDLVAGGRLVVFLVLPPLSTRGGLVGVVSLLLCSGLVTHEDGPICLLAGGMVGGDVTP